jgi:hypothetical protein
MAGNSQRNGEFQRSTIETPVAVGWPRSKVAGES